MNVTVSVPVFLSDIPLLSPEFDWFVVKIKEFAWDIMFSKVFLKAKALFKENYIRTFEMVLLSCEHIFSLLWGLKNLSQATSQNMTPANLQNMIISHYIPNTRALLGIWKNFTPMRFYRTFVFTYTEWKSRIQFGWINH